MNHQQKAKTTATAEPSAKPTTVSTTAKTTTAKTTTASEEQQ